ncbi:MAG: DegT/DnrJ/EryC1/StrS aminotransferase family protein, partial [Chloroflexi bacterium]|nr:DegT/DnrJ/EryC1/StrS aminotransferase family protein [Chloroflexota bacterium]
DIGCYSFFGNKNMTTAEGGMLTTNDDSLAEKIRLLRSHGMTTLTWDRHQGHASSYDVVALGYNYRIDELRSAIGREQLKKLPAGNARRAALVGRYRAAFSEHAPSLVLPFGESRGNSSQHILPVLLPTGADKQEFRSLLKQDGIQTSFHYPPVHTFEIYNDRSQDFSNSLWMTEHVAKRQVTLPLFPTMTDEQQQLVIESVVSALARIDAS